MPQSKNKRRRGKKRGTRKTNSHWQVNNKSSKPVQYPPALQHQYEPELERMILEGIEQKLKDQYDGDVKALLDGEKERGITIVDLPPTLLPIQVAKYLIKSNK